MQIRPTEAEFTALARQGNVIPVYGELSGDLETPVSAFLKLDDGRFSFLLESVEGSEKLARYSFLGSRPRLLITSVGRHIEISELRAGRAPSVRRFETTADPLREVERLMSGFRFVPVPGLPRFTGGFVGYLGYNAVRFLERLPAHATDDLRVPDVMLMLADTMVIFDHAQRRLLLVVNAMTAARSAARGTSSPAGMGPAQSQGSSPAVAYREAVRRIHETAQTLKAPLRAAGRAPARRNGTVQSNLTPAAFARMVRRAKSYIRAGDVIQVVLSQRWSRPLASDPLDVYRALRSLNPSPYMYCLRFGSMSLVGTSPEMLVRCEDGKLETRPIAGTRPRGKTAREEERLIRQLRASPKERAEHLMLVDLGRNDLGRVARTGSVRTPELMIVEKYSHVLHLVSGVTGTLKPGKTIFDVLRATFPAGTVSGAPKVRAMEIIAELEQHDRGTYAGAVGYLSFSGNLDTCITIRTILIKDGRAYVQAGAGIVADSQPSREFQETRNKARGMLQAIEISERRVT